MSAVAFLILHPRLVFQMRGVVSLLLGKRLVLQLPNHSAMVSAALGASSYSPFSAKQLPAIALEERVCGHPPIDLAEFDILSFVVTSSAFNNLQSSHPLSLESRRKLVGLTGIRIANILYLF